MSRFPFCDVFLTSLQRGVWRLRGREGRSAWPEEWYTQEQVWEHLTSRTSHTSGVGIPKILILYLKTEGRKKRKFWVQNGKPKRVNT